LFFAHIVRNEMNYCLVKRFLVLSVLESCFHRNDKSRLKSFGINCSLIQIFAALFCISFFSPGYAMKKSIDKDQTSLIFILPKEVVENIILHLKDPLIDGKNFLLLNSYFHTNFSYLFPLVFDQKYKDFLEDEKLIFSTLKEYRKELTQILKKEGVEKVFYVKLLKRLEKYFIDSSNKLFKIAATANQEDFAKITGFDKHWLEWKEKHEAKINKQNEYLNQISGGVILLLVMESLKPNVLDRAIISFRAQLVSLLKTRMRAEPKSKKHKKTRVVVLPIGNVRSADILLDNDSLMNNLTRLLFNSTSEEDIKAFATEACVRGCLKDKSDIIFGKSHGRFHASLVSPTILQVVWENINYFKDKDKKITLDLSELLKLFLKHKLDDCVVGCYGQIKSDGMNIDHQTYVDMGWIYVAKQNFEEAIEAFKSIQAISSDHLFLIAQLYLEKGEQTSAENYLSKLTNLELARNYKQYALDNPFKKQKAAKKEYFKKALCYFDQELEANKDQPNWDIYREIYDFLIATRHFKTANLYLKKWEDLLMNHSILMASKDWEALANIYYQKARAKPDNIDLWKKAYHYFSYAANVLGGASKFLDKRMDIAFRLMQANLTNANEALEYLKHINDYFRFSASTQEVFDYRVRLLETLFNFVKSQNFSPQYICYYLPIVLHKSYLKQLIARSTLNHGAHWGLIKEIEEKIKIPSNDKRRT